MKLKQIRHKQETGFGAFSTKAEVDNAVYEIRKLLSIDANEHFTDKDIRKDMSNNVRESAENIEYGYNVWVDWMVERSK